MSLPDGLATREAATSWRVYLSCDTACSLSCRWSAQKLLGFHCAAVDGHADYGVDSHGVKRVDLAALLNSSGYD
jgi:hypothetical protein